MPALPGVADPVDVRSRYPLPVVRALIQFVIGAGFLFGLLAALLRRARCLAVTGIGLSLAALLLGGANMPNEGAVPDGLSRTRLVPVEPVAARRRVRAARAAVSAAAGARRVPRRLDHGHVALLRQPPAGAAYHAVDGDAGAGAASTGRSAGCSMPCSPSRLCCSSCGDDRRRPRRNTDSPPLSPRALALAVSCDPSLQRRARLDRRFTPAPGGHRASRAGFTFIPYCAVGFRCRRCTPISSSCPFTRCSSTQRQVPRRLAGESARHAALSSLASQRAPEAVDKNFAVHMPWIDRLFGTYHMPRDEWPTDYGIAGDPVPEGYAAQLIDPFTRARK